MSDGEIRKLVESEDAWSVETLLKIIRSKELDTYLARKGGDLEGRLVLEAIRAVKQFEASSGKLSRRMEYLTGVLLALTGVIAIFTFLLWYRN